jgi:hypothetical protein
MFAALFSRACVAKCFLGLALVLWAAPQPNLYAVDGTGTWLENTRVHIHMRIPQTRVDDRDFYYVPERMADLGSTTYTRHVKTDEEDPLWSLTEFVKPKFEPDVRAEKSCLGIVRDFFRVKPEQNIIAYYWLGSDDTQLAAINGLGSKDLNGRPSEHDGKGRELDITNTEYQDYVISRLIELSSLSGTRWIGADGVYFDNRHGNTRGVFGTALEGRYRQAFPGQFPSIPQDTGYNVYAGAMDDANYVKYLKFNADELHTAMARIVNQTKNVNPNFKFIISCGPVPALASPLMTSRIAALSDAPKSEFKVPVIKSFVPTSVYEDMERNDPYASISTRISFGFNLLRTVSNSMPHIWSGGFKGQTQDEGKVMTEHFVAAAMGYGGIAALDLEDDFILTPSSNNPAPTSPPLSEANVKQILTRGQRVSNSLKSLKPMKYAAIIHSEGLRQTYLNRHVQGWQEAIAPTLMTYEALQRWAVPVDVINDTIAADPEALKKYKYVFFSKRQSLPSAVRNSLTAYANASAGVLHEIVIKPNSNFRLLDKLTTDVVERARLDSPVRRTQEDSSSKHHYSVFTNSNQSRIVIAAVNDVSWIREDRSGLIGYFTDYGYEQLAAPTPQPAPSAIANANFVLKNKGMPTSCKDVWPSGNTLVDHVLQSGTTNLIVSPQPISIGSFIDLRF